MRLKFLEYIQNSDNKGESSFFSKLDASLKTLEPVLKTQSGMVYIDEAMEEVTNKVAHSDSLIKRFEKKDFCDALLNRKQNIETIDLTHWFLTPRERFIIEEYYYNDRNPDEIGKTLHLSKDRVHQILEKSHRRLRWHAKNF